jgi:uncharacterized RDD family membrane protein YckC
MPPGVPAPLAEWWERLVARIIDGLIYLLVSLGLGGVIAAIFVTQAGFNMETGVVTEPGGALLAGLLSSLIAGALFIGYEFLMLRRGGQTLGKLAMRIKVVPLAGGSLGPGGLATDVAAKRAVAMFGPVLLTWIPGVGWLLGLAIYVYWILAFVWQFVDKPYQQSLLDKVATTVVVKAR